MNNLLNTLDYSTLIAAVITVAFSLYTFKKSRNSEFIVKRYENLIFPLFDLIEDYLYKPFPPDVMDKALTLIENNKYLAGGRLLSSLYFCRSNLCKNNSDSLCDAVNKELDECCSCLGLHKRKIWYRVVKQQYKTKFAFILYITTHTLLSSIVLCSFLMLLAFIIKLINVVIGVQSLPLFP